MAKKPKSKEELQSIGDYYVRKFSEMYGSRLNWDSHWEEVAEYSLPRKDNVYGYKFPGERKFNRLYDSTSVHAVELLAANLHGVMTNPTTQWFWFGHQLQRDSEKVGGWLQGSAKKQMQIMNRSNFTTQIHETYLNLSGIGTSVLYIEKAPAPRYVNYVAAPIYPFVIDEDQYGRVDTIGRKYQMSRKQLLEKYKGDVPECVEKAKATDSFDIIHFVEPNRMHDPKQPNVGTNMKYRSIHVLKKTREVLKIAGYRVFPFAVPRWTKIATEKYGRSPAMKTLPDIKMLNAQRKVLIRAQQKAADPNLVVPDQGVILPKTMTPGEFIYKRPGTDKIEPILTGARPDLFQRDLELERERIRKAFFIDQLQLINQKGMTATEVMQRTDENLRLMSPILGRIDDELLRPTIDRTFDILFDHGVFGDVPAELEGEELEIEYVSQIARAQRDGDAQALLKVIQSVSPLLEITPQLMGVFNGEKIIRNNARKFGLPADELHTSEELEAMREAQAKQQAAE